MEMIIEQEMRTRRGGSLGWHESRSIEEVVAAIIAAVNL
jgi:hypothetical protein